MTTDSGETYLPAYDAMGNVHAMIKGSDGSVAAAYEYDAFGRTIRESGPYAASNPFRFSTKYTDVETELVYFGLRYYSPTLGRFISRDPIGEQGGLNLYAFVGNNGVNGYDFLGMDPTVQNVPHNAPDPDVIARIHADWERIGETRWLDHGNNRILVYMGERGEHQYNAYPDEGGFNAYFGFGLMEMDDTAVAAWRAATTADTDAFLNLQPVLPGKPKEEKGEIGTYLVRKDPQSGKWKVVDKTTGANTDYGYVNGILVLCPSSNLSKYAPSRVR